MTLRHVTWALDLEGVDAIARMILVTIGEEADDFGAAAPGLPKLARRADCSEQTVRRRLGELARLGLVERLPRQREDGGTDRVLIRLRMSHPPFQPVTHPPATVEGAPLPACQGPPLPDCNPGPDVVGGAGGEPQAARAEPEPKNPGSIIPPLPPEIPASAAAAVLSARGIRGEPGTPVGAFLAVWPLGAFEPPEPVAKAWGRLEEADRKAAIEGAPKWLAAKKRAKQAPGKAVAFLRSKGWQARATVSVTAAQGGVYVRLGTPAADAWFEVYAAARVAAGFSRPSTWPDHQLSEDPETGRRAIFRPSLFPPRAQGPPHGGEGEAA